MLETVISKKFVDGGSGEKEVKFVVSSNKQLEDQIIQEIQNLPLDIWWSDSRSVHWSYDTKLSNGKWLENIKYNNELNSAVALVLN